MGRLLRSGIERLVVALPPEYVEGAEERLLADPGIRWVAGGTSRQESVAACLAACRGAPMDLVLVHDGARPAVAREDVAATVAAASEADGAVLGRPLGDTLKRVEGGMVAATVDRGGLFRAETPQVFPPAVLERALSQARRDRFRGTDEASLVERLPGVRIRAVVARWPNPKVTEPGDLRLVAALLGAGEEP